MYMCCKHIPLAEVSLFMVLYIHSFRTDVLGMRTFLIGNCSNTLDLSWTDLPDVKVKKLD